VHGVYVSDLVRRPGTTIDDDAKQTYIALWIMKKLDLDPKDGGMEFPVVLPAELQPLDEPMQQMAVDELLVINQKKNRWDLTKQGIDYLREAIDEATDLLDEFDDAETAEMVAELRSRNLDPFRARFLWGWYEGELDDLVVFQERRGVKPVERLWAFYLVSDEFYAELAKDLSE
jgi:hypothetical protein